MESRWGYQIINKSMNGTYILVDGSWYQLLEVTGTCYVGEPIRRRGERILKVDDFINDRLIISSTPVDIEFINSLENRIY